MRITLTLSSLILRRRVFGGDRRQAENQAAQRQGNAHLLCPPSFSRY